MDTRVIVCESLRRTCNYLSAYLFIYRDDGSYLLTYRDDGPYLFTYRDEGKGMKSHEQVDLNLLCH